MKPVFWIAALAGLLLTGCGDSGPIEITDVREFDPASDFELPVIAESVDTLYRYSPNQQTPKPSDNLPEGWKELPATTMRNPNLRFGENDEGECYVTRLAGGGGGLAQNVNRWLGQMGAEKLSEEQVAELPKKTLYGQPATVVSADGTFAGMGGQGKENYRLHGLILNLGETMVTVKMTGPKELVEQNMEKFDEFCETLGSKAVGK